MYSDAGETVGFAETGDAYEAARLKLGEAIEAHVSQGEAVKPAGFGLALVLAALVIPPIGAPATGSVIPRDSDRTGPEEPAGIADPSSPDRNGAPRGDTSTLVAHPRLFVAERDPFSGLPALKARWAAGERPSEDLPGLALSWLLSGDESYARRALEELRADRPTRLKGSNAYVRYVDRSMAFDWLYDYPGFDTALKDQVAADLVAGAEKMLALPSLADPAQASYHNHTARELALAVFSLVAVEGHASVETRAAPLREHAWRAFDNILEQTELVDPDGGYHESTDYMRITWAPLAMMAEVRRTATGNDPAARWSVFRNMGTTYLYKILPDGSEARDDDDEFPHLDSRDNVVLGYAVHRFKDPYAAFLLQQRGWLPAEWANPVLEFLWKDASVLPRDPATTTESELPRERLFRGIGHLVLRDGWGQGSTWIQLACGPYFAKHDHLDAAHLVVYHKGYLAIDAGADYTDTESPHYLNHYRRTVAHNTVLVYQPGETFFWGENKWTAANDGGQRMDSSRFWNSVRSLEDWRRTRDLWDRCQLSPVATGAHVPLRPRRRDACLPGVEARALHARDRPPAGAGRARRARPGPRHGPRVPQGLAPPRRQRAAGCGPRRRGERRKRRDGVQGRLPRDVRGRPGPAPRALAPAARAGGDRARRAGVRVLDAGRRARRGLGNGAELAPRPAGGRPPAGRPVPAEDVEDVLGRDRPPLALEPPRRRPGRLADGGVSHGTFQGRRLPQRPGDRRPGRGSGPQDRSDRRQRPRRRGDRGRGGRPLRERRVRRGDSPRREDTHPARGRPRARAPPTRSRSPPASLPARPSGAPRRRPATKGHSPSPGKPSGTGACACGASTRNDGGRHADPVRPPHRARPRSSSPRERPCSPSPPSASGQRCRRSRRP